MIMSYRSLRSFLIGISGFVVYWVVEALISLIFFPKPWLFYALSAVFWLTVGTIFHIFIRITLKIFRKTPSFNFSLALSAIAPIFFYTIFF
jgi:hypothetical protein